MLVMNIIGLEMTYVTINSVWILPFYSVSVALNVMYIFFLSRSFSKLLQMKMPVGHLSVTLCEVYEWNKYIWGTQKPRSRSATELPPKTEPFALSKGLGLLLLYPIGSNIPPQYYDIAGNRTINFLVNVINSHFHPCVIYLLTCIIH